MILRWRDLAPVTLPPTRPPSRELVVVAARVEAWLGRYFVGGASARAMAVHRALLAASATGSVLECHEHMSIATALFTQGLARANEAPGYGAFGRDGWSVGEWFVGTAILAEILRGRR